MTAIIIQARMGSTRLPGKIMKDLAGHPVLWHVVERCRKSKKANQVIVATTANPEDDLVEQWCRGNKVPYYRGSSENVLERYYQTAKKYGADAVVRITSDCPLIDPQVIDWNIEAFQKEGCDYLSNFDPGSRTFPIGLETEVFPFSVLEKAYQNASEEYEKEHVTPYIWENKRGEFSIGNKVIAPFEYRRTYRIGLDYPEDFLVLERIYKKFYAEGNIIHIPKVLEFLDGHPEIVAINAHCKQKLAK